MRMRFNKFVNKAEQRTLASAVEAFIDVQTVRENRSENLRQEYSKSISVVFV